MLRELTSRSLQRCRIQPATLERSPASTNSRKLSVDFQLCRTFFARVGFCAVIPRALADSRCAVTGLKVWFSVLSIGLVCTFYTSVVSACTPCCGGQNVANWCTVQGGIKAVVWTDLFQVLLMGVALLVVVLKGAHDVGGWAEVWAANVRGDRVEFLDWDPDPRTRHTVWSLAIGGYFTWITVYGVNQTMVQRYLALPSLAKARRAVLLNLPGLVFILVTTSLAGMVIYARYELCDPLQTGRVTAPDQLFPLFVMDILGELPGLPGLFVAGIFSGALSTVSSGINSLAAVTLEDGIKTYIRPDISDLWATRLAKIFAFFYGILSIALVALAERMGGVLQVSRLVGPSVCAESVVQAALSLFGMMGGPLLGLFTLGMFFPWPNPVGAGVGLLAGLSFSFWVAIGAFLYKTPPIPKPTSVIGCATDQLLANATSSFFRMARNASVPEVVKKVEVPSVYRLSYMWYSAIGCVVVVVVGLLVSLVTGNSPFHSLVTGNSPFHSLVTGPNKAADMNPKLFSPFFETLCYWLPRPLRDWARLGVRRPEVTSVDLLT
ncbi:hypothetical protein LAZ67_1004869 [Cordylochernes scorpioides]|uniref:Sodium-coupled monocarboxylate transporter 1 n=1 Tax=Cordylochernes scorpioides TaxID=51811 RepID=A0ABY6JY43_9ARAC|nr:hypothetical protein LAZ67_1004869 [Cordylochernes scorpioides]